MMLKSRFEWTILLLVTAFLGSAWIIYSRSPSAPALGDLTEAPRPGYLAPDFTLTTITGQEVTLADFRGRPVVLNFWATWCVPCRLEMPYFQSVSVKYGGQVAIIGVNQGETARTVTDFAGSTNITYPLPLDQDNRVSSRYQVRALPTTVFIDARGVVHEVHTGLINQAVLEDRIERLLRQSS